jgi:hypothetical protein
MDLTITYFGLTKRKDLDALFCNAEGCWSNSILSKI